MDSSNMTCQPADRCKSMRAVECWHHFTRLTATQRGLPPIVHHIKGRHRQTPTPSADLRARLPWRPSSPIYARRRSSLGLDYRQPLSSYPANSFGSRLNDFGGIERLLSQCEVLDGQHGFGNEHRSDKRSQEKLGGPFSWVPHFEIPVWLVTIALGAKRVSPISRLPPKDDVLRTVPIEHARRIP